MSPGAERLHQGQQVTATLTVGERLVDEFAGLSGDDNPLHMDGEAARRLGFPGRVAHGAILLAEISRIIGTELPGRGSLWLSSEIEFSAPVYVGDTVVVEATVAHASAAVGVVLLELTARRKSDGAVVLAGTAKVMPLEERMPFNHRPLGEQCVIVSGGTRGLGRVITRALLDEGARVIALYRTDASSAATLEQEAGDTGGELVTVQCDVTDSGSIGRLFDEVVARDGRGVDSFVHAASPRLSDVAFADLEWATVLEFLETYVKGAVEITQRCLPSFRERGTGRVVLIGSEAVQSPKKNWAHYVTGKSAYTGLVRALAMELADVQATANLVSPGTLHGSDILPANVKTATRNATPLKRLASEEEVGEVVAFLLGKGGSFISGANIPLTGGRVFFG